MRNLPLSNRLVASLLALGISAAAGDLSARADTVASNVSPNPVTITCGTNTLGTLTINEYTDIQAGDLVKKPNNAGAAIEATFNQTYMPNCDLNLQWIQVVTSGVGTIGQTDDPGDGNNVFPYLDPYERDDNLPFYWTTTENGKLGTGRVAGGQPGSLFSDVPNQPATNNGNSILFETALVAVDCKDPTALYWLAGFTWGYGISGGTSSIDDFHWTAGPSGDMTTAVEAFDGTANYVGDGDTAVNNDTGSAGYHFADGCPSCCCDVPLPSAGWMTLVSLAGLGVFVSVRGKFASTVEAA